MDVTFRSKRNTVLRRDGLVEKRFASAKDAAFEAAMLGRLSQAGLCVPRLISRIGPVLTMTYCSGKPLPDLLAELEATPNPSASKKSATLVINWLARFYRVVDTENTGEIRGDVNGQNFFHPPKTPVKTMFAKELLDEAIRVLDVDLGLVAYYREKELSAMKVRRRRKPW